MDKGPIRGSKEIQAQVKEGIFYAWFPDRSQCDIAAGAIENMVRNSETITLTKAIISFHADLVMISINRNVGVIYYSEFITLFD